MAAAQEGVYDLVGRNLKLTTAEDAEPYVEELRKMEPLHEVHLGGNTLGVGAVSYTHLRAHET